MTDPDSSTLNSSFKCYDFCIDSEELEWDDFDATDIRVETPDYAILLDHTIGVIWKLFNKDSDIKSLDHFHLIWALKFLEGIKPSRGHVTKDVDLLKILIRNLLVHEFAGSDVVKPEPREKISEKDSNVVNQTDQSVDQTEISVRDDDDMDKGFMGDDSHLHTFSDDPWYEHRRFSVVDDGSHKSNTSKGVMDTLFGLFSK